MKHILSSSHKPSEMVFLSHNQTDKDFLGIELEFQWSSSENRNKILEFLERYEDLYLKEDGSVPSGCEIVTFPATKDYHINRFKKILFEMNQLKCVSHDSDDVLPLDFRLEAVRVVGVSDVVAERGMA